MKKGNATPLDVIFILSTSVTLLLLLLWIIPGHEQKYANAPAFLQAMVSSVWAKFSLAGASVGALVLRRFIDKSPAPNYLICIPGCILGLMAALLALAGVMYVIAPHPDHVLSSMRIPVRIGLDRQFAELEPFRTKYALSDFNLWEEAPDPVDAYGVIYNSGNPRFPYSDTLSLQPNKKSLAFIKLSPAISHTQGSDAKFDYEICLKTHQKTEAAGERPSIMLACAKGVCDPAKDDPGYVVGCDASERVGRSGIPTVLAAEPSRAGRERGWDVPSVQTLAAMTDRQRVGYTLFTVSFVPEGKAAEADRYYYVLRVNGAPVYIDGLSPELKKETLHKGALNRVDFALENLNFTGENDGYEKLQLTLIFLKGDDVTFKQELARDYAALRDAPEIPPFKTEAGSFTWTGTYKKPNNENKYEIILASSVCGDPPQRTCLNRALEAKRLFVEDGIQYDGKPMVMVVRPPLRKPPAYGLVLGLVQPTSQVQFTFNEDEAHQLCARSASLVGKGRAGKLIRFDLRRYEVATRGYAPCH